MPDIGQHRIGMWLKLCSTGDAGQNGDGPHARRASRLQIVAAVAHHHDAS